MNSYDLSGSADLHEQRGSIKTTKQLVERALKNPQFGKLRDGRALTLIPEVARDAVLASRSAQVYYNDLCPAGVPQKNSRPGKLFSKGLCVEPTDAMDSLLATIETVAQTNMATITFESGETLTTNVPQYVAQPIRDVRTIAPTAFDACGEVVEIADATLGGLTPKAEISDLLKRQSSSHECVAQSRR